MQQRDIENGMLRPQPKWPYYPPVQEEVNTCGCGAVAEWEVYKDKQMHCQMCFEDATSCDEQVLVRRI
jgi:hypothetical protein